MENRFRVRTDPGAAYPETAALRTALKSGDWPTARTLLDGAAPAARTTLMITAQNTARADRVLDGVLAADPSDPTAAAMLGFHRIGTAWRIRTSAQARQVSRRRFRRFHAELHRAEEVLATGLGHTPDDPAILTATLTTARGLQMGLPVARGRYERLAAVDPNHLPAQSTMLQQLCPKWGGRWDLVHAFSREAMAGAPPGSPNAVLVADAYLEQYPEGGRNFMSSPYVRDAVTEAAHASVLHPDFRREPGWVQVMNTFAMAFSLAGDRESAAAMFTALGPYATLRPWSYEGDSVAVFRRSRALAFGWSGPSVADWLLAGLGTVARRDVLALFTSAWR
ncbi:hypothetical protein [Actinoplanes sp. NPDC051851]|uniref:hypothetical protein n=1 Tax=Actinoplanes sp. NPDC051851 TaxID=3154753 RepID=UPI00341FCA8D